MIQALLLSYFMKRKFLRAWFQTLTIFLYTNQNCCSKYASNQEWQFHFLELGLDSILIPTSSAKF